MNQEATEVSLVLAGTARIPERDIEILVTSWSDGTGEVAFRQLDRRDTTWSAPYPLSVTR